MTVIHGDYGVSLSDLTTPEPTLEAIEDQLVSDFRAYRSIIAKEIKRSKPKNADKAKSALKGIHSDVKELWEEIFNPAIHGGYVLNAHGLDNDIAEAAVGRYSGVLADQINDVSDRAFLEGYNAAISKGWDRALAWQRIADTYGLDPVQMRQWVTSYPTEDYQPEEIPKKSRSLLEKMLNTRARKIASNEVYTLKNLGKQALWEQQRAQGEIPDKSKKVWRTAKDELVCPVCAPMDAIAIPVTSKFKTGNGKFFVPPVHINCRCDVYILNENDITKSMGNDRWNRDLKGRFSRLERRNNKRGVSTRKYARNLSAFGVQNEAVEPKKSDEELERERIDALPTGMQELKHGIRQLTPTQETRAVSELATRGEEEKVRHYDTDEIKALANKMGKTAEVIAASRAEMQVCIPFAYNSVLEEHLLKGDRTLDELVNMSRDEYDQLATETGIYFQLFDGAATQFDPAQGDLAIDDTFDNAQSSVDGLMRDKDTYDLSSLTDDIMVGIAQVPESRISIKNDYGEIALDPPKIPDAKPLELVIDGVQTLIDNRPSGSTGREEFGEEESEDVLLDSRKAKIFKIGLGTTQGKINYSDDAYVKE